MPYGTKKLMLRLCIKYRYDPQNINLFNYFTVEEYILSMIIYLITMAINAKHSIVTRDAESTKATRLQNYLQDIYH